MSSSTAGLVFLLSIGLARDAHASRPLVIVALGDSTTAGTPGFFSPAEVPPSGSGDPESQYAFWMAQDHPEWTIHNQGVRGQRSDQIRQRFGYAVLSKKPDWLIVLAGVNDLYQGYGPDPVKTNLSAIYDEAQKAGIRVIACTLLPYDFSTPEVKEQMAELNAWIESESRKRDLVFCDTHHLLEDPKNPGHLRGTPDGIHPDVTGYRRMGEALTDTLEDALLRPIKN